MLFNKVNGKTSTNDIQYFAGGSAGCKHDPFLPENFLTANEIRKQTKPGKADNKFI